MVDRERESERRGVAKGRSSDDDIWVMVRFQFDGSDEGDIELEKRGHGAKGRSFWL